MSSFSPTASLLQRPRSEGSKPSETDRGRYQQLITVISLRTKRACVQKAACVNWAGAAIIIYPFAGVFGRVHAVLPARDTIRAKEASTLSLVPSGLFVHISLASPPKPPQAPSSRTFPLSLLALRPRENKNKNEYYR
ncbi:hypothetical protein K504DRAFT_56404 [Pleomassaria siparia CBS 279.74]|uniref:Uncharacterized protein n=1 Tax=Pleomassaria siparia CBS 279.74 TaxID=1314801 RepID=A0A6G1K465_9PLEO|nr:hypothetical protein K504DRAFT_56404 [Pleomassaria siparia CBS 279.74]